MQTKLFVVSIIGVIIIANVSVLIISTAQNDVIDIQLGRAHVSKIFPENNSVPLVPDIKVGANATRLALIDAVIMRGCNRPAVFYCIVVDIARAS